MSGLTAAPKRKAGAAFAVLALVASLMIGFANPASAASTVTPKGLSIGGEIYGTYGGNSVSPSAGLIGVDTDGNGSVDAYAYCIDLGHPLANNQTYTEGTWNSSNVPNLGKITWILQHYPASAATPQSTAMAVQAAIWHFSDGFDLTIDGTNSGNSKAVEELYSSILANATDVPEPHPTLTITPSTQSGEIQTGLVYDVVSTAPGPVALSVAGGPPGTTILPVGNDGTCQTAASPITSVNLVGGAAKVCLYSATPGADATLTGTVTEATASGRVFLYGPNPNGKQKLIFAGGGTVSASATAKGTWVETAQPRVTGAVVCSAQGGTITVTVANDGNGTVAFDVYSPNADTLAQTVNVGAKDSKTVDLAGLPDGTYDVPVVAQIAGQPDQDLTIHGVVVDCDAPGVPVVSSSVACTSSGGQVTVTLANEGTKGKNLPVTFTVTDPRTGTAQDVTVAPGVTEKVVLTGFSDGSWTIPVSVGETSYAEEVDVACSQPVVEGITLECAGGGIVVGLGNEGTNPTTMIVRKGDTVVKAVEVAPGATTEVLVSMTEDETATITVTSKGDLVGRQTVPYDCQNPTTTAAPTTSAEVAGITQTPVTPSGALPYTGGDVLRTVLLGLGLAAAGFGLVAVTRRRRS